MNLRPSGYEPDELPGCSTPRRGVVCEERGGALVRSGGDLLSRAYGGAVPSAVARLTAEFGMGSGVSRSLWPPDRIRAPLNIRFQVKHHLLGCA